MKNMQRWLVKLEAAHPMGAAHQFTPQEAAFAYAELTKFMDAICAEKAAGDVNGIADRQLAAVLAEMERAP